MCDTFKSRSVLSGSLGRKSTFNLIVNGEWDVQAASYLIRLLELQVEWFETDDKIEAAKLAD